MRYGIIGAGRIAHAFLDALRALNLDITAIASRDITKANDYKNTYGIKKAYDSYEALLSDKDVDIVYIATPHGLHYEHIQLAIKHHKHIICEKALVLNEQAAKHVFDLAKANNLFLMEAMWTKFLPITKALLESYPSMIGNIKKMDIDFSFKSDLNEQDRLFDLNLGGGALLDIGIYTITYANLFLGVPKVITASATFYKTGADIDDDITYHYDDAVVNMHISNIKDGHQSAIIYGDKGKLIVPHFFRATEASLYDLDDKLIKVLSFPHIKNGYEYEIMQTNIDVSNGLIESTIHSKLDTLSIFKQLDHIRKLIGLQYPNER